MENKDPFKEIEDEISNIIRKIDAKSKDYFLPEYRKVKDSLLRSVQSLKVANKYLIENEKDKNIEGQMSIEDFLERD